MNHSESILLVIEIRVGKKKKPAMLESDQTSSGNSAMINRAVYITSVKCDGIIKTDK